MRFNFLQRLEHFHSEFKRLSSDLRLGTNGRASAHIYKWTYGPLFIGRWSGTCNDKFWRFQDLPLMGVLSTLVDVNWLLDRTSCS